MTAAGLAVYREGSAGRAATIPRAVKKVGQFLVTLGGQGGSWGGVGRNRVQGPLTGVSLIDLRIAQLVTDPPLPPALQVCVLGGGGVIPRISHNPQPGTMVGLQKPACEAQLGRRRPQGSHSAASEGSLNRQDKAPGGIQTALWE